MSRHTDPVRAGSRQRDITLLLRPFESLAAGWQNRVLIQRIVRREVELKYRGSLLGVVWAILTPLLMLGAYSVVFLVILPARWQLPPGVRGNFVLIFFSGLLAYTF